MDETAQARRLAELRKSVSQMTDEELHAHIGASRNNRRKPPPPKTKKAKKKSTSTSETSSSLEDQLSDLSPEQAAAILKKLQG